MALEKLVYYIPEGVPNLQTLFPGVPWNDVTEWFLEAKDDADNIVATTRINKTGCCCNDRIRIHFINSLGEVDSINFGRAEETHETKSESWEQALRHPLDRTRGGLKRKTITSNEAVEAETKCYPEDDQYWIKELYETPMAWLEVNLPNGFLPSITKQYIPIQITDMKFPVKKVEKRYEYMVKIKFLMANSNILLR